LSESTPKRFPRTDRLLALARQSAPKVKQAASDLLELMSRARRSADDSESLVLACLMGWGPLDRDELANSTGVDRPRLDRVLDSLLQYGVVSESGEGALSFSVGPSANVVAALLGSAGAKAPDSAESEAIVEQVYALRGTVCASLATFLIDAWRRLAAGDRELGGDGRDDVPGAIVGRCPALLGVLERARLVAPTDLSILVTGENGTGKELLVEYLRRQSRRADQPLVVFDCAAVAPSLIESELFGHKRGAFTGAHEDRTGALVRANGGTLFLDEIGELALDLQPKLLRALEQRTVRPVGSPKEVPVDVRIIAATNRDLEAAIRDGRFREDIFHRLAQYTLHLPPLRERGADQMEIAKRILEKQVGAWQGVRAGSGCAVRALSVAGQHPRARARGAGGSARHQGPPDHGGDDCSLPAQRANRRHADRRFRRRGEAGRRDPSSQRLHYADRSASRARSRTIAGVQPRRQADHRGEAPTGR